MAGGALTALCYACCPFLSELLSPREALALSVTLFLAIAALLFGLAGQNTEGELTRWSLEDWQKSTCWVEQVGIEYSGDCNLHMDEGVPFDYGKWPPVKKSNAEAPDYDYAECPEAPTCSAESAAVPELAVLAAPKPRQGINMPRYNLVACQNSFLPWASVEVVVRGNHASHGATRFKSCGFRLGYRFHEDSLDESQLFLSNLSVGGNMSCWSLHVQDCRAVALEAPERWPCGDRNARTLKSKLLIAGFAVSFFSLVILLLECCTLAEKEADPDPDTQDFPEVSTYSARVRRLRERWNVFQASLLQQYEPLSARDVASARERLGA